MQPIETETLRFDTNRFLVGGVYVLNAVIMLIRKVANVSFNWFNWSHETQRKCSLIIGGGVVCFDPVWWGSKCIRLPVWGRGPHISCWATFEASPIINEYSHWVLFIWRQLNIFGTFWGDQNVLDHFWLGGGGFQNLFYCLAVSPQIINEYSLWAPNCFVNDNIK